MTNWIEKSVVPVAAAIILMIALTEPAGIRVPHPMRIAVLGGIEGPVYYSVVDGGYRAVVRPAAGHAAGSGEQMASAAK